MRIADIKRAYIILRKGKWDIPAYFGDGKMLDMHLGYLLMDLPFGVPFTLDQAYPFVGEAIVALGFPDIIFEPKDAFAQLLAKYEESKADIVLGLFHTPKPHKSDMVKLDENGRVHSIHIKPPETDLEYSWGIAVWSPLFTEFMHNYVVSQRKLFEDDSGNEIRRELFVGDVIQAAITSSITVDTIIFRDGKYLDIGTPEDMVMVVRENIASKILAGEQ
jgi:glucose-1-phosphate thymidylyltransferase